MSEPALIKDANYMGLLCAGGGDSSQHGWYNMHTRKYCPVPRFQPLLFMYLLGRYAISVLAWCTGFEGGHVQIALRARLGCHGFLPSGYA